MVDLIDHAKAHSDRSCLSESEFAKRHGISWRVGSPLFGSIKNAFEKTFEYIERGQEQRQR